MSLLKKFASFLILISVASATQEKILVLTLNNGLGHQSVVDAIVDHLPLNSPPIETIDILEHLSPYQHFLIRTAHLFTMKHMQWLQSASYDGVLSQKMWRSLIKTGANIAKRKDLREKVRQIAPTHVLSPHALSSFVAGALIEDGGLPPDTKLLTITSDYGLSPSYHVPDHLFVASEEQAEFLIQQGKNPDEITVLGGLPPRRRILIPDRVPEEFMRYYGFKPDVPLLLLVGGGEGLFIEEIARYIIKDLRPNRPVQFAIVTGKNEELRDRLNLFSHKHDPLKRRVGVQVFGFVKDMGDFLRYSDLVIGKPGGALTTEVLAVGAPLFVYQSGPAYEQSNLRRLKKLGLLGRIKSPSALNQIEPLLEQARKMRSDYMKSAVFVDWTKMFPPILRETLQLSCDEEIQQVIQH